ncbi:single strand binding protein [Caudoviricetes sp.]|nr:single strand binding protein [Caudoviricetes sp.]
MIFATVAGNIGKDATMRQAGNDSVCSFGVASESKVKGQKVTTWVDCSIWGKRGAALCEHLLKGSRVTVVGELSTREHNGKTYLSVRVSEIALMGGGNRGGNSGGTGNKSGGGYDDSDYGGSKDANGDDLPF